MFPLPRFLTGLLAAALLAGCSGGSPVVSAQKVLRSQKLRETAPQVSEADAQSLSSGNQAFALDLYHALPDDRNLFFSPYSISQALAMTYAGARGATAQEMADTLYFRLADDRLHPAINALDQALGSRKDYEGQGADGKGFRLNIVNDLWGQADHAFASEYLDLLSTHYGAGIRLVDFRKDAEGSRKTINDYIAEQTEQRIKDLVPKGAINLQTRLVLTNAIYFNAAWLHPFDTELTELASFTKLDGSQVNVDMMRQSTYEYTPYIAGDGYQAVALDYENPQLVMWLVVPDEGHFEEIEAGLNQAFLDSIVNGYGRTSVLVSMPQFTVEDEFQLRKQLSELGMPSAFDPDQADFSGIDNARDLYIGDVIHKSFVKVDEAGTEAAAATAVVLLATGMMMDTVEMMVDRPFIFFIYDEPTQTILFMGRVLEP